MVEVAPASSCSQLLLYYIEGHEDVEALQQPLPPLWKGISKIHPQKDLFISHPRHMTWRLVAFGGTRGEMLVNFIMIPLLAEDERSAEIESHYGEQVEYNPECKILYKYSGCWGCNSSRRTEQLNCCCWWSSSDATYGSILKMSYKNGECFAHSPLELNSPI